MIVMTEKEFTPSKHGVYFLELELENVRCFGEKVKIDLRDPKDPSKPARWTVLVGENGVGKTTVLRSLVSVAPFPKLSNGGGVNSVGYWPADSTFSDYWNSNRNNREAFIGYVTAKAILGTTPVGTDSFEYMIFPSPVAEYPEKPRAIRLPSGFENSTFTVLAYGASRHMGTRGIEEDPLKNASLSLFKDNAELTNASELFHQTYINSQMEGESQLHETLKSIILTVLPNIAEIRSAKGNNLSRRAEVLTPYGWVWIHDLSLGYKTMVAWIVDFASKLFLLYPNSPNPLAEPAVCLVDEIDLHMHPTWQRKIMGFLTEKFPNTQFIVTAHSPLMVQASADANIVLLKREGDHVVVDNDPIVVKNWSVDQILSSVFGVSGRMEETEIAAARRRNLQSKASLTSEEHEELLGLDTQLRGYSVYETAEQREAVSLLDTFTKIIKESNATKPDDQHP